MKTLNLVQGSPEWLAARQNYRTASEASAMMGVSKYMSRSELLSIKATGIAPEVSATTQRLFDRGHETEAGARVMAEKIIGEELFPATVTDDADYLLASLDGMTMLGDVIWEHKLWNADLVADVQAGRCPECHYWQVIQGLVITGAEKCLFMVSDGTPANCVHVWVTLDPSDASKLMAGWKQFDADKAAHVPAEAKAAPVAAPVETLPAIVYQIDRSSLALTSNLPAFRAAATALVERSKAPLVTDQDFADREALCKAFGEAEKLLKMKAEEAIGQIQDVATFSRELGDIAEQFRAARLASEKLVEAEKKNRRAAIVQKGERALCAHLDAINDGFKTVRLGAINADFAGAIRGKKSLASIQDAVDTTLAQAKIEADARAAIISANLASLDELAPDHGFLFRDLQQLVTMPAEAFRATVEARVATHKAQEQARLDAERERIRQEEAARLAREQAAAEAARQAEEARKAAEERAAQQAELDRQAEEIRRQREEWELEQERARIAEQAERMAASERAATAEKPAQEPPAEMQSDVADLISSRPADVQPMTQRAPQRPTDEQIVMVVADTYQVSEDVAYGWLASFGRKSEAA